MCGSAADDPSMHDAAAESAEPTISVGMTPEEANGVFSWLDGMVRGLGIYAAPAFRPQAWATELHLKLRDTLAKGA